MKIKQRKPTNKCFSEPTNIEHQGKLMDVIHFHQPRFVVTEVSERIEDVCYHINTQNDLLQIHIKIHIFEVSWD